MYSYIQRNTLKDWDVLVVDDEPDSLEVATHLLRFYGANVYTACDGQQAFKMVKEMQPDFIISDLTMPNMDGWALVCALKENRTTQHIPVIALTAHPMDGDRGRALQVGFHNYLIKPLTPGTFVIDLLRLLIDVPELGEKIRVNLGIKEREPAI